MASTDTGYGRTMDEGISSRKPHIHSTSAEGFVAKGYFNQDDVDAHLSDFVEEDKNAVKTSTRTFVENVLQHVS